MVIVCSTGFSLMFTVDVKTSFTLYAPSDCVMVQEMEKTAEKTPPLSPSNVSYLGQECLRRNSPPWSCIISSIVLRLRVFFFWACSAIIWPPFHRAMLLLFHIAPWTGGRSLVGTQYSQSCCNSLQTRIWCCCGCLSMCSGLSALCLRIFMIFSC